MRSFFTGVNLMLCLAKGIYGWRKRDGGRAHFSCLAKGRRGGKREMEEDALSLGPLRPILLKVERKEK